jgi:hypothetical protein
MRTLLLQVHLYAALLCSSYFVLFGISSLNYNHKFGDESRTEVGTWERQLRMPELDDRAMSQAVRDTLDLPGWTPWWRYRTDDEGTFHFELVRPGKHYDMRLSSDGLLRVEEFRTGFWPVVNQLHAMMALPNAPLLTWWGVYTEFCFWVVVGSAASGVYLWTRRRSERRVGWCLLGGVSGASLLLMLYIYYVG